MFFEFLIHGSFSIHAPVWGATNYLEKNDRAEEISIHAPRMGSDQAFASLA